MTTSLEAKSPLTDAIYPSSFASNKSDLTTELSPIERSGRSASLIDDRSTAFIWRNAVTDQISGWGIQGTTYQTSAFFQQTPALGSNSDWKLIDAGDFDGNGSTEFLWRNPVSDEITVWGIEGTSFAGSTTLTGGPKLGRNSPWTLVGAVNLDNTPTLVWRNQATDETSIWRFNDQGEYQSAAFLTNTPALGANSTWKIADVSTSNNQLDIVWRNQGSDQTAIWGFDGTEYQSAAFVTNAPQLGSNSPWEVVKSEDVNGDNNLDLIWQNRTSGEQAVWFLNNGTEYDSSALISNNPRPDSNWQIVGVLSVNQVDLSAAVQAPTAAVNSPDNESLIWRNAVTDQITTWGLDTTEQAAAYVNNAVVQGFPLGSNSQWQLVDAIARSDGGTQYLWRNQVTDQTSLWNVQDGQIVEGPVIQNAPVLGSNSPWRLVANVFLDSADTTLIWRNQTTDQTALWTIRDNVFQSAAFIENAPTLGTNSTWQLVDAANRSDQLDLVWRNRVTDQTALWTIDGSQFSTAGFVANAPVLGSNSPWQLVKTEDVNDDSSNDLIWQNFASGQQAVWYLDGYDFVAGPVVSNGPRPDANWRIAGAV